VCSKGCNQLVKVSKVTGDASHGGGDTNREADKFDLVVCQADKRVICAGRKKTADDASETSECVQEKQVKPMAICKFSVALWNMGGTCIANHVHGETSPQCAALARKTRKQHKGMVQGIMKECRKATVYDDDVCDQNPDDDTCKQAARERDYCSRLAMSF
jgi:hypothetical protein